MFYVDVELDREEAMSVCLACGIAAIVDGNLPSGLLKIEESISVQADRAFVYELDMALSRIANIFIENPLERELCKGSISSLMDEFKKTGM